MWCRPGEAGAVMGAEAHGPIGDKSPRSPVLVTYSGSRRASDMKAQEQVFLWKRRLPVGHLSVIGGVPSIGKSTLNYHVAAAVDVPTIFVTTEEADTRSGARGSRRPGSIWTRPSTTRRCSSRGIQETWSIWTSL